MDGVALPSTHCVDLPFTFNWFADPAHDPAGDFPAHDDANAALAVRWVAMLASYARTGDPGVSLGEWPRYTLEDRTTWLVAADRTAPVRDLDREYRLEVW
jgi:carboxylesterase type B